MNKSIYKGLLLVFFMASFMFLDIDVMAAKADNYNHKCTYTFTDHNEKSSTIYVYPANNEIDKLSLENIEFEGTLTHPVSGEKKSRETGLIVVDEKNKKFYCPDIVYFCYDGDENALASSEGDCQENPAKATLVDATGAAKKYTTKEVNERLQACVIDEEMFEKKNGRLDDVLSDIQKSSDLDKGTVEYYIGCVSASRELDGTYCDSEAVKTLNENSLSVLDALNKKQQESKNLTEKEKADFAKIISDQRKNITDVMRDYGYANLDVPSTDTIYNCNDLLDDDLKAVIQLVLKILRIAAPIILIALVTVDFSIAVISNNDDAIKKATSKAIKRAIAALVLFFIPLLVSIMINWIDESGSEFFGDNKSDCANILESGE